MFVFPRLVMALLVIAPLVSCGGNHTGSDGAEAAVPYTFSATSLEGYWICRSDDVEVHITQVGERSIGNGSYKDVSGRMIPAGKFQNIRYMGGNKWSCEQWIQGPGQLYDPMRGRWEEAVIEMLGPNRFKVGNTLYTRV